MFDRLRFTQQDTSEEEQTNNTEEILRKVFNETATEYLDSHEAFFYNATGSEFVELASDGVFDDKHEEAISFASKYPDSVTCGIRVTPVNDGWRVELTSVDVYGGLTNNIVKAFTRLFHTTGPDVVYDVMGERHDEPTLRYLPF